MGYKNSGTLYVRSCTPSSFTDPLAGIGAFNITMHGHKLKNKDLALIGKSGMCGVQPWGLPR